MGPVKTTIEIPEDLFRRTKATAALRGESLKDFVTDALRDRLDRQTSQAAPVAGWRSVFGRARPEEVDPVDAKITAEFERVEASR
jgi:hypothetical protein